MARFKLPIFVVVVEALALAGMLFLGGRLGTHATVQTIERLGWGQTLFETSLRLAQSNRTAALASASSELAEVASAIKDAAPTAAVADPVRKAVPASLEKLPASVRRAAFLLVGNEKGVAVVPAAGGAADLRDASAFRLAAAGQAGPAGTAALVDGKLYSVAAAALRDGGKVVGWLGAAFPLDDTFASEQAKDLAMPVSLVAGGTAVSSLPADKRSALASAKDGPVAAPLAAAPGFGPLFAGSASLATARTFALEGAEGAKVVLISESSLLVTLADFQKRLLFAILAVLAVALAFLFLGREEVQALPAGAPASAPLPAAAQDEPAFVASPQAPAEIAPPQPSAAEIAAQNAAAEAAFSAFRESTGAPPAAPEPAPAAAPEPAPEPAPAAAPEPQGASPFEVPSPFAALSSEPMSAPQAPYVPAPTAAELAEAAASSDPTAMVANPYEAQGAPAAPNPMVATPFHAAPPAAGAERPFDPFAEPVPESTVAAPVSQDLLQAARNVPEPAASVAQPESTVVAQIPEELLRAARAHLARTAPGAAPAPAAPPPAAPSMSAEELHFHEVFDQFVATRTQCSEPADGLTYDKFAAKLRKNRDQLVFKYNCKSVRFQVYVKDGKAALKATPVRE